MDIGGHHRLLVDHHIFGLEHSILFMPLTESDRDFFSALEVVEVGHQYCSSSLTLEPSRPGSLDPTINKPYKHSVPVT
jgi:hypothetical protein